MGIARNRTSNARWMYIDSGQTERRAELTLMLADAAFYLLDILGTECAASAALALAQEVGRGDIAGDALGGSPAASRRGEMSRAPLHWIGAR